MSENNCAIDHINRSFPAAKNWKRHASTNAGPNNLREKLAVLIAQGVALANEVDQLKLLGNAIANAAIKRGIITGYMPLTGPQLIALCADLAVPSIHEDQEGRANNIGNLDKQTITMSGNQLRQALDLINPDGPNDELQCDDELTFGNLPARKAIDDESLPAGLYCWNDDTDGVMLLTDEWQKPALIDTDACSSCGLSNWQDFYTGPHKTHDVCASCNHKRLIASQPAG